MNTLIKKSAIVGGLTAGVLASTVLTVTPAHAGGPGSQYAKGSTYSSCERQLNVKIVKAKKAGAQVTGVYNCFKSVGGWYGGFVANY